MDKFIVKAPKPLNVSTEAALSRSLSKTTMTDLANMVKDIADSTNDDQLEVLASLESKDLELDESSTANLASLYWGIIESKVALQTLNDKMKSLIQEKMEAEGKSVVEASTVRAKFQLSKPSVSVSYDIDALKDERPDVYDKCTDFSGSPMDEEERKEIEFGISQLQTLLAELNKMIVEDNAARTPVFNDKLFQKMAEDDDSLKKFINVKTSKSKFYFKEMKDDAE